MLASIEKSIYFNEIKEIKNISKNSLVTLAAVSIRAVTNMKIVDYAVNGAENYAKAGKAENKTLDDTVSFIDEAVAKIENATQADYSAEILAQTNGQDVRGIWTQTLTLSNGTKALPLGPSFTADETYYLCEGKIYKVSFDHDNSIVMGASETNMSSSELGYNYDGYNAWLTTVNGTYTTSRTYNDPETNETMYVIENSGYDYSYNSAGIIVYIQRHLD